MRLSRHPRRLAFLAGSAALTALTVAAASQSPDGPPGRSTAAQAPPAATYQHVVSGFTSPSRKALVAALQQGRIHALCVPEGETARAGDPLVQLDDGVQRARTELAQLEADSTLEVELADVRKERADEELNRLSSLGAGSSVSAKELSDARTAVRATGISLAIAQQDHARAVRNCEIQRLLLEQHRIVAPFDGVVSEHLKPVGETVEERQGVVTLVQLDPLEVRVDCPLEWTRRVTGGDRVSIQPVDAQWSARAGVVSFIGRVADPASQTVRLKVLVPNPDGVWIAGMKVTVRLEGVEAARAGH